MSATKNGKATKKATVLKHTRLCKIGRLFVYLEESEGTLQHGPTGKPIDPAEFLNCLATKGEKRRVRRALDRLGLRGLAKETVAPQQISFDEMVRLQPQNFDKITNRQDQENFNQYCTPNRKYKIPTPTSKMAEVETRHPEPSFCEFCPLTGGDCSVCGSHSAYTYSPEHDAHPM